MQHKFINIVPYTTSIFSHGLHKRLRKVYRERKGDICTTLNNEIKYFKKGK